MKLIHSVAVAATVALSMSAPAFAHHSFAMFDRNKTMVLDGTVTEFQFTNPHSWLEINVPDAGGAAKHYSLEMNNLVGLRRVGWRAKTLQAGDKVKVEMHPMRDGSSAGQLMTVTMPGGQVFDGQGIRPITSAPVPTSPIH